MRTADSLINSDRSSILPAWLRAALWTTAVLNLFGAILFVPNFSMGRTLVDLPANAHPLYLWIIAEFIFIMGVGYGYCAWSNRGPAVFLGVGAAGKLAFFATLAAFSLSGDLPALVALLGSADLVLGGLFLGWLIQSSRNASQP